MAGNDMNKMSIYLQMCNNCDSLHIKGYIRQMIIYVLNCKFLFRSTSMIYGIVAVVTVVFVPLPVLYLVYQPHEYARGDSITVFIYLFIPFVVPPVMQCILNTVPRYSY